FLSLAPFRMRSSACDPLPRLCVRHVLCWSAFPLVPALGSADSAAVGSTADCSAPSCSTLFAGFTAVESGGVELVLCLCPLAQTARAVFPPTPFLFGRPCGGADGLVAGTR